MLYRVISEYIERGREIRWGGEGEDQEIASNFCCRHSQWSPLILPKVHVTVDFLALKAFHVTYTAVLGVGHRAEYVGFPESCGSAVLGALFPRVKDE